MSRDSMLKAASEIEGEIISYRRYLHQYPELAFQEYKTSEYTSAIMEQLGFKVKRGLAVTGFTALLDTGKPGRCIAVRADMDALPLQERTGLPFASRHEGLMHACGHDGHMAMALGAAKLLHMMKGQLKGRVKFIFQPAEELLGGARDMIRDGALDNPVVDGIIGLHLWPKLPTGRFAIKSGTIMASMDHLDLTVLGKSSHGASPHQGVDAIIVAAHMLSTLQLLVSRERDPADAVVVSMGMIQGGELAEHTC